MTIIKTTLRIESDVWKAVKEQAVRDDTTIQQVCQNGLDYYLKMSAAKKIADARVQSFRQTV